MFAGAGMAGMIIGMAIFALVQISIFRSLPCIIRKILACFPMLGVIGNFLLSGCILMFTGVGQTVGFLNLAGSIIFGVYLVMYRHHRQLGKPKVGRTLGIVPYITIEEYNKEEHWLF